MYSDVRCLITHCYSFYFRPNKIKQSIRKENMFPISQLSFFHFLFKCEFSCTFVFFKELPLIILVAYKYWSHAVYALYLWNFLLSLCFEGIFTGCRVLHCSSISSNISFGFTQFTLELPHNMWFFFLMSSQVLLLSCFFCQLLYRDPWCLSYLNLLSFL